MEDTKKYKQNDIVPKMDKGEHMQSKLLKSWNEDLYLPLYYSTKLSVKLDLSV